MRICLEDVVPGATLPKSMSRLASGNQPPSLVLMEKLAIGAVEADPSRMVYTLPPSLKMKKYEL